MSKVNKQIKRVVFKCSVTDTVHKRLTEARLEALSSPGSAEDTGRPALSLTARAP